MTIAEAWISIRTKDGTTSLEGGRERGEGRGGEGGREGGEGRGGEGRGGEGRGGEGRGGEGRGGEGRGGEGRGGEGREGGEGGKKSCCQIKVGGRVSCYHAKGSPSDLCTIW